MDINSLPLQSSLTLSIACIWWLLVTSHHLWRSPLNRRFRFRREEKALAARLSLQLAMLAT